MSAKLSQSVDIPAAISLPLAEFVAATTFTQLPALSVQMAKRCLLDAIGVSLAASGIGEGCNAFAEIAIEQGGKPSCTLFGRSERVPAEAAAFANGALAHAIDYEDAHDVTLLHPNAPSIPAAIAVAEAFGPISGQKLITAIAVGCEVAVRMALALRASLSDYGWYPPPILAAFGSTAASAQLLGLNAVQVRDAFSLTCCQATCSGEIKYSPDSVLRAVRDAFAARTGVTSALLAKRGVTGFDQPLEGRAGFYAMFARGAYEPTAILKKLGQTFEIENISFKPWPSCRGTHAGIQGILNLRERYGLEAGSISEILIRGGRIMQMLDEPHASKRRPATAIDAKFSIPFTVGAAMVHNRVSLEEFLPATLTDERVLEVAKRVTLTIDQSLAENSIGCDLTLKTIQGASHEVRVDSLLGNPDNPMSEIALIDKFVDCARYARHAVSSDRARTIARRILQIEEATDIGAELMTELGRA